MADTQTPAEPSTQMYVVIWLGLVLIVGAEVLLTYQHLSTGTLLMALLVLAVLEATIGVMYFMHLKYEKSSLFWALIPYLVFALLMMNHVWPDAHRLLNLRAGRP